MAQTTRTAVNLASNGAVSGSGMGPKTDVLQTVDVVTTITVISLLAPLMLAKIYIKKFIVGGCCREDSVCFFAWILTTAYCTTGLLMAAHGGGNHEWEVSPTELITFRKILYADTILYGPAAFLTKTTLLLISTRVFAHCVWAVRFIYGFIVLMACYYIPVLILKIRLCTPIGGLWDPHVDTKCFDQKSIFFTDALVSAITDAVVLFLPAPLVCTLKVSLYKRVRIGALLGAGGIATVASTWRAVLVWSPNKHQDITVTFVRINLLAIAEVGIGIVCACIPTFNILFTRYTKEHWGPNSRYGATGERSPALKTSMRDLTRERLGVSGRRKGHRYKKSWESEADGEGEGEGEGEGDAVILESLGRDSYGEGKWPWGNMREDRRQGKGREDEDRRQATADNNMDTDVECSAADGDELEIKTGRHENQKCEDDFGEKDGRRQRGRIEDSGWPLSGGGDVVPFSQR